MTMPIYEKSVAAHLNLSGLDRLWGREDTQLDCEMRSFFFGDWRKTVVIESRGPSGLRHRSVDRITRVNVADASPQFAPQIKRSERSTRLGKTGIRSIQRNLAAFLQRGRNGVVRQAKQLSAFLRGEFWSGTILA